MTRVTALIIVAAAAIGSTGAAAGPSVLFIGNSYLLRMEPRENQPSSARVPVASFGLAGAKNAESLAETQAHS